MFDDGEPVRAIAAALGRTMGSVDGAMRRYVFGIRGSETAAWNEASIERLRSLYVDYREPARQIARIMNVSTQAIREALVANNITRRESSNDAQTRKCMCCAKPFWSAGRGNRNLRKLQRDSSFSSCSLVA